VGFREHLKNLAEKIEDLTGVAIADMDGMIIEEYKPDPAFDMAMMVAEYGTFWYSADKAGLSCDIGLANEVCVFTEKATVVIRKISQDYFLILAIAAGKGFGKGRFHARMIADLLEEEIEA